MDLGEDSKRILITTTTGNWDSKVVISLGHRRVEYALFDYNAGVLGKPFSLFGAQAPKSSVLRSAVFKKEDFFSPRLLGIPEDVQILGSSSRLTPLVRFRDEGLRA